MSTKTDCIREIEDMMGSNGSHAHAEAFYQFLWDENLLIYTENSVFLPKMSDDRFYQIWAVISEGEN